MDKALNQIKSDYYYAKTLLKQTFTGKLAYHKNKSIISILQKRAFYNEILLMFGQLMMAIVTHFHYKNRADIQDPDLNMVNMNVETLNKIEPYVTYASLAVLFIRVPLLLAYFRWPQVARSYIYV